MSDPLAAGAAATPHTDATAAAHQAFADGGNAIDAALAAAAMLTVVYPNQCSIGGDAIAMVGTPDGHVEVVNGSGRSARELDPADYVGPDGFVPVTGAKSVTVPGALSAWESLADRWGRRSLGDALRPAAAAAATGVAVAPGVHRDLVREQALLAQDDGARHVFFPDGTLLSEGQTMDLPRLADTLTAIADRGTTEFYRGPVGASVIDTLRRLGSDLTTDDLRQHLPSIEHPCATYFAGAEYLSSGGNSQGTFFLQGLSALDIVARRLGRIPDPIGQDASIVARILTRTAADRDRLLGDPDDAAVPVAELLGDDAIEALAEFGLGERAPAAASQSRTYARRSGDTVAIVTADTEGNWVSLIQSAFHAFGSCVLDPETGILLHNRGASFSLEPASANQLGPGRRPPHTLMPVLVRHDGNLVGAHGTMGGRAQPQVHTHLALNLALGMTPEAATARPRWIVGQMEAGAAAPDEASTISLERGVPAPAVFDLSEAGFHLKMLQTLDDSVGHLQVVRRDPADDSFRVGSDPRSDGLTRAEQEPA
ncbi:gamma-glutamyltransferase family protein [Rhodococcus sp. NPDC057529]|uniref:gamma-glutamyltransferase family protein n=1 Tax=Rhodococcus sp. NPDC057529 TaxID=3346158 RepID=UPI00367134FB